MSSLINLRDIHPELAIDGIISSTSLAYFQSHEHDAHPWFQVELPEIHEVARIDVYNRQDTQSTIPVRMDFEYIQVKPSLFIMFIVIKTF